MLSVHWMTYSGVQGKTPVEDGDILSKPTPPRGPFLCRCSRLPVDLELKTGSQKEVYT